MTQMRELENGHHEKVTEIGLQYLENCIKGTLEEEPPDNLRKVPCVRERVSVCVYVNVCLSLSLTHTVIA